ncbi:class I SAM-dependent methyltransferase [Alsobacter sp. SYSU BS001988]
MSSGFSARSAEGYEQLMGRWSRKLARGFVDFAGQRPGEAILDVGCGTGSLTFTLAEMAGRGPLTGIDVAEPYLAYARSRSTGDDISFQRADATDLPFGDGAFDRALSCLVLQFTPDPAKAVAEMARVVRPGGVVAACVWDSYGGMPHLRLLWDTASALGLDRDRSLFRPMSTDGEMAAAWRAEGLRDVVQDTLVMRFDFEDFDDYWSPFLGGDGPAGQFVAGLGEADRDRLRTQARHVFLSGRPDGRRSFVAAAWACRGVVA